MRRIFIGILWVLLFSGASAIDHEHCPDVPSSITIPEAGDFAMESKLAASQGRIIMLLVSQVHCPYCVLIKEDIIHPMIIGGDHADKLSIRELYIDRGDTIRDFDGKSVSGMAFAKKYGASFTPTLLFLDPQGRELTERMIGINTPEMYFYYIDQSIRKALLAASQR